MSYAYSPTPTDDTARMKEALKYFDDRGILFTRKTAWQIKHGKINFYPDRGTIFVDGENGARKETGLQEALLLVAPDHDDSKAYSVFKKRAPARGYQAVR